MKRRMRATFNSTTLTQPYTGLCYWQPHTLTTYIDNTHHHHLCTCVQRAFRISCRPGFHYNTLRLWGWDHIIDIIISFFCERAEIWEECPCHKLLSNHLNSEHQKEKETWFNIWFRAHIPKGYPRASDSKYDSKFEPLAEIM